MIEKIRAFKNALEQGHVLGPFSKTSDPGFIEVLGHAGFDFVILDLEHGPNGVETVQRLIRSAELSGVLPIVRVKEGSPSLIGEVLDVGAAGVQVPQIENAEDARKIIKLAKFSPMGERGVCRFVRAADYAAMDRFEYFKQANERLVILQIEGEAGLNNIDEILAVEGCDIIFIGPYDLSQSLGVPGETEHEKVTTKMKEIVRACERKGMAVGTFVEDQAGAEKWRNLGVKYLCYSVDVGLFYERCREVVNNCGRGQKSLAAKPAKVLVEAYAQEPSYYEAK